MIKTERTLQQIQTEILNLQLVSILRDLVETYPAMRLGQILSTFGFVTGDGEYYLEPETMLQRVQEKIARIEHQASDDGA